MLNWNDFILFASCSVLCWLGAAILAYTPGFIRWVAVFSVAGIIIFGWFIGGLWLSLERPPLRTLGETRLFYAWFMSIVGLGVYLRWRYAWILSFSTLLSLVFIVINILKPEIHDRALMPALQSLWFVPHVVVYIFAYALLGCALIIAGYGSFLPGRKKLKFLLETADNMVYTGWGLLTLGMLFGALWAKQAWGHYWGWDPKETWALITWLVCLMYIHARFRFPEKQKMAVGLLVFAFLCLQLCWYGVNYLPSASQSIHTYAVAR